MSLFLLLLVVLSWGFSWYGITLQVAEDVPALVSIAYRFFVAAIGLGGFLVLRGRLQMFPLRLHPWLAVLGFCLFCMNFFCFYFVADRLTSGLMSVMFSTAAIMGAMNQWLFFKKPLEARVVFAAFIGVGGLILLLWDEMTVGEGLPLWVIGMPLLGTFLFSVGNLISARLSQDNDLPSMIAHGMIYGALVATVGSLVFGLSFNLPSSGLYWSGVVYLALISSVLAFLAYLNLLKREGPARASYATVLFPLVAMVVSTYAEGFEWGLLPVLGLIMTLGGTVMVFAKRG